VWVGGAAIKGRLQSWTNEDGGDGKIGREKGNESNVTSNLQMLKEKENGKEVSRLLADPLVSELSFDERYLVDYCKLVDTFQVQ